mgnify:CR=1 FL=1
MNIEANKAIVRKYIELWSTGNLALADEVLAADFVDHTHPNQAPGPESVKQEVKVFREGFPDARITVEQMIGEGDTVAFRFVLRGTHLGTFAGFPPTGKENVLTGADFVRIADGKIVELWSIQETLSWAQQLGLKISRDMIDEHPHTALQNDLNNNTLDQSTEPSLINHAAIELLRSWREADEYDEEEQKATWEYLKQVLDEDRLSDRKFFA